METKNQDSTVVAKVNGHEIVVMGNNHERLIPIKPICEALGVDPKNQRNKIQEDDILSSIGVLSTSVGGDGKQREMFCLPLQYVFGWLFTINPKNVNEASREIVTKYRQECYDVLYKHFFGNLRRQIEMNTLEISLLEEINQLNEQKNNLTNDLRQKKMKLDKIRDSRLKSDPVLNFVD